MLSASGDLYTSADGTTWSKNEALSGNMVSLIGTLPANEVNGMEATLCAIRTNADGQAVFCTTTDLATWTDGETIPDGFPTRKIYTAIQQTGTGIFNMMAVGMPQPDSDITTPWFTMDGSSWANLATSYYEAFCPYIENPAIIYYGGDFYMMGSKFDAIYTSITAIGWYAQEEKFLPAEQFLGKVSYSLVVDNDHYIWLVFGGNGSANEVWRGRMNRLGFEIQY